MSRLGDTKTLREGRMWIANPETKVAHYEREPDGNYAVCWAHLKTHHLDGCPDWARPCKLCLRAGAPNPVSIGIPGPGSHGEASP